jgi:hypothetical protein
MTILEKLDWVFGSSIWITTWSATCLEFFPKEHLDHSVVVEQFGASIPKVRNSFKFLNFWADRDDFLGIVEDVWCNPIEGTPMYRFTRRLS